MVSPTKNQTKAVRKRCYPVKRWTPREERLLVDFLLGNQPIEKPLAQPYYKRFSKETKVLVQWKLVRAKVRNMRTRYNKAKDWGDSKEAAGLDEKTIKDTLKKMFHYIDEFDEIFQNNGDQTTDDNCFEAPAVSNGAISDIMKIQYKMILIQKEKLARDELTRQRELSIREKEVALREKELSLIEKEFMNHEKQKILELRKRERVAMEQLKIKYKNRS